MRNYYFAFLIIILLIACKQKVPENCIVINEFPIEKIVALDSMKVEPVLFFVGDMILTDSLLITIDLKNDVFFQYFAWPGLTYCGSSTIKGNGPKDEIAILPALQNIGSNSFAYRTIQNVKVATYNSLSQDLEVKQKLPVPECFTYVLNTCLIGNELIGYGIQQKSESEYIKWNFSNKSQSNFGPDYPHVDFQVNEDKKNILFSKSLAVRRDGKLYAALYDKFPLLRIYNAEGSVIVETSYENHQPKPVSYNNPNGTNTAGTLVNYLKIKVTDNYIYGLYVGKTHEELQEFGKEAIADYGREIHIWDWNGTPVARLSLDKPVSNFAVSQDDSCLLFYSTLYDNQLYTLDITTKL